MKGKILITDDVHESLLVGLDKLGFKYNYLPAISLEATKSFICDYQGLVINSKIKVGVDFLKKAKNLKFIARLGSGLDIMDLEAAKLKSVQVINSPEGNANAVGEHALGMLLCLANNILSSDAEVRKFEWHREKNRGFELANKTIGIVGFGNTGTQFAQKLCGFGVQILAYDKYKQDYAMEFDHVREVDYGEIFTSDIISFHLPLTTETHYFCDSKYLNRCKKGIIIINTSRGKVLNIQDLVEGLETGQVEGACLDVFENEIVDSFTQDELRIYTRLYQLKQVVLTPHIAGWTHESKEKIARIIIEKIARLNLE